MDAQNPEKPPEQWVSGDEPMTGPQASYLQTLAREAGEDVVPGPEPGSEPGPEPGSDGKPGSDGSRAWAGN